MSTPTLEIYAGGASDGVKMPVDNFAAMDLSAGEVCDSEGLGLVSSSGVWMSVRLDSTSGEVVLINLSGGSHKRIPKHSEYRWRGEGSRVIVDGVLSVLKILGVMGDGNLWDSWNLLIKLKDYHPKIIINENFTFKKN